MRQTKKVKGELLMSDYNKSKSPVKETMHEPRRLTMHLTGQRVTHV